MNHLQERAGYSVEVNVIAMYYLNKICAEGHVPVTVHSWRALWSTAVIIAQKTWEDVPIRTSAFADILPNMSKVCNGRRVLNIRNNKRSIYIHITASKPFS